MGDVVFPLHFVSFCLNNFITKIRKRRKTSGREEGEKTKWKFTKMSRAALALERYGGFYSLYFFVVSKLSPVSMYV